MELWQTIISTLGALGGLTTLIGLVVFFRQIKRKKTNEADEGEIKNLTDIIDRLQTEVNRQNERITTLEKLNGIKDSEILILEKENMIYKRAINCQIECEKHDGDCPVTKKLNELSK